MVSACECYLNHDSYEKVVHMKRMKNDLCTLYKHKTMRNAFEVDERRPADDYVDNSLYVCVWFLF